MANSLLQHEKECYITGIQTGLDKHHIYGGVANRPLSEKYGCWVWLKHSIHMDLHDRNKKLDKKLKAECQLAFERKYDHGNFMKIFKKNYLDTEVDE